MDARQRLNHKKKKQGMGSNSKSGKKPPVRVTQTGKRKKNATPNKKSGAEQKAQTKNAVVKTAAKTKTLTRKISDLRQIITSSRPSPSKPKQTISQKKSAIKQRLGLQSKSARERIRNAAASGSGSRSAGPSNKANRRPAKAQSNVPAPTIIIAQTPASNMSAVYTPSSGRQASGYSVIVSNLNPSVTQADILELFSDVGSVRSYQSINSSTSMVTFSDPREAASAVQTYNNRLLDGQPMIVTLLPVPSASAPGAKRVSQTFRRVFSRSQ